MYTFKIIFTDDKSLDTTVDDANKDQLQKCLTTGSVFTSSTDGMSFWTPLAGIRYFTITKQVEASDKRIDATGDRGVSATTSKAKQTAKPVRRRRGKSAKAVPQQAGSDITEKTAAA